MTKFTEKETFQDIFPKNVFCSKVIRKGFLEYDERDPKTGTPYENLEEYDKDKLISIYDYEVMEMEEPIDGWHQEDFIKEFKLEKREGKFVVVSEADGKQLAELGFDAGWDMEKAEQEFKSWFPKDYYWKGTMIAEKPIKNRIQAREYVMRKVFWDRLPKRTIPD